MNLKIILDPGDQLDLDTYSKMARDQIGNARFEAQDDQGRHLSFDEALAVGLNDE